MEKKKLKNGCWEVNFAIFTTQSQSDYIVLFYKQSLLIFYIILCWYIYKIKMYLILEDFSLPVSLY